MTAIQAVIAEQESEETSERVRRGQSFSAARGRPHGLTPYGYRRVYDTRTRALLRQEPDDGPRGTASVVREIFDRLAGGEPVNTIRLDLGARGVPSPGRSPATSGSRRARAGRAGPCTSSPATGPTSVSGSTRGRSWRGHGDVAAAGLSRALLGRPAAPGRPGPAGQAPGQRQPPAQLPGPLRGLRRPLSAGRSKPVRDSYEPAVTYSCSEGRHASIMASVLDAYVLRRLLDWLADPEILADLTRVDDAEAAALARADADRAQAELAELHQLARAGRVSSAGFSAQEEGLLRRIEEADRRMRASAVPSVVAGVLGPDAGDRFGRLDLAQQREVVRQVAEIRVRPVGRGRGSTRRAGLLALADRAGPRAGHRRGRPPGPREFYGRAGPVPGPPRTRPSARSAGSPSPRPARPACARASARSAARPGGGPGRRPAAPDGRPGQAAGEGSTRRAAQRTKAARP